MARIRKCRAKNQELYPFSAYRNCYECGLREENIQANQVSTTCWNFDLVPAAKHSMYTYQRDNTLPDSNAIRDRLNSNYYDRHLAEIHNLSNLHLLIENVYEPWSDEYDLNVKNINDIIDKISEHISKDDFILIKIKHKLSYNRNGNTDKFEYSDSIWLSEHGGRSLKLCQEQTEYIITNLMNGVMTSPHGSYDIYGVFFKNLTDKVFIDVSQILLI